MNYKMYALLVACLWFALPAKSQSGPGSLSNGFIPNVIPPSPNAASLGKFGAWPVSYYTGVADVSIPVYEIKSRKLSLPVSLQYHGSGIKVEEVGSWVGTGWALNAGGVITRTIIGLQDNEPGTGYYSRLKAGYRFPNSYALNDVNTFVFFHKATDGNMDTEPDAYFFNFNGRSGKFFFDENGNFHSIPENALKLTKHPFQFSNAPNIWEIIDESGNAYTFGSTDGVSGGVEQGRIADNNPGTLEYFDNAWYLTSIISADKSDTITLKYEPKTEVYGINPIQSLRELTSAMVWQPMPGHGWQELLSLGSVLYNGAPGGAAGTRNITTGRGKLSAIKWPQGELKFSSITTRQDIQGGSMLDTIQVNAVGTGSTAKKLRLQYSYRGERYFLDSISELSSISADKLVTSFYYYPGLPSRFSNSQDHWGYFNAAANNHLLPSSPSFQTSFNSNREPNIDAAKSGTLRRVKYPTGGYTDFDYEEHRYAAGTIPNAPTTEIGSGVAWASTYNYRMPNTHDSIVTFNIPFNQSSSTIAIKFSYYSKPPAKNVGWLPYINLERQNSNGTYTLINSWNAYDLFPGGANLPLNPDGTVDFTVPLTPLSLITGTYRLTVNNSCTGVDCPESNLTKAVISAYVYYQTYVQLPGTTQPPPIAGGLRIKSITNYDNIKSSPAETKKFVYAPGYILTYPKYLHYYAVDVWDLSDEGPYDMCMVNFANYREITSSSQVILGVTQGSSVGYTDVKEYSVNNQNVDNGYTRYTYLFTPDSVNNYVFDHSYWSSLDINDANRAIPATNFDYKRGLLSEKTIYTRWGDGYAPVSSMKEEYNFNEGDTTHLYHRMKALRVKKLRTVRYPCGTEGEVGIIPNGDEIKNDFGYGFYNVVNSWVQKTSTEEKTFNVADGSAVTKLTRYYYDNNKHLGVTRTTITDSKGDMYTTSNKYAHEMVSDGNTAPYSDMVTRNMIANVVEQKTVKNVVPEIEITKSKVNYTAFTSTLLEPAKLESSVLGNPLEENALIQQYDAFGHAVQYRERNGLTHALIFDYNNTNAVANVTNANVSDIAYNSFESTGTGNWQFSGLKNTTTAFTGKNSYTLSGGNIVKSGLDATKSYIVSYWSKGASALVNSASGSAGRTLNGWTYYQHVLIAGPTTITVSGTIIIDELRLYPQGAQMTTFVYDPLIGLTAQCDINNTVTFYEYDGFKRLLTVRDQYRNILKQYAYNYSRPVGESSAVIYFNTVKSQSFTKTNCTSGTPSAVIYTVPAEKYTSYVSQADADGKASADITANGPANANIFGLCSFYNIAKSKSFIKKDCAIGATASSVVYAVPAGKYVSNLSQADADNHAQLDIDSLGQTYANTNGTCTFYNVVKSQAFSRTCTGGTTSPVTYTVIAAKYSSTISQADADNKALAEIAANGQNYANTNGVCTYTSDAMSQTFTKVCTNGATGSVLSYNVAAAKYSSIISKADANAKALADINTNGQTYVNTNGTCRFYNVVKSGTYTKNNCTTGYVGNAVTYTVAAGTVFSETSQAAADALAQAQVTANGQNNANSNGVCSVDPTGNLFVAQRAGTTVTALNITIKTVSGTVIFNQSFKEPGDPALPYKKILTTSSSYTVTMTGMQSYKASVNGTEQTVTGTKTWNVSLPIIIEVYN